MTSSTWAICNASAGIGRLPGIVDAEGRDRARAPRTRSGGYCACDDLVISSVLSVDVQLQLLQQAYSGFDLLLGL